MTLASSHPVRIQVCGALAVERDGQRLDARLPGRQGRLLFTYLVVNRHRHVPRDEVAEALWREPDPAAVDARVNPLLSKLRRVFGADSVDGRSTIRLCLPDAWVDLEAAAEAIHRAESSVAQQDWARAWGPALTALFVAERDFLPGEDAPWIDEIRHQLTELRLRALECYAAAGLGLGGTELAGAVRAGRQLTRLAPLRESGYRYLWGLHLSGADEQRPRDAVVVTVGRAKILWLLRLDGDPYATLCRPSPPRTTSPKPSAFTASSASACATSSASHPAQLPASSTNASSLRPER